MATRRNSPDLSIRVVRKLRAPLADAYASWIQPELLAWWLTDDGDTIKALTLDVQNGGDFRVEGSHSDGEPFSYTGTYLEIIKERRIAFSWEYAGPNRAMRCGPSVVVVELRSLSKGMTELSVKHRLLAKSESLRRKMGKLHIEPTRRRPECHAGFAR
ncbi:SRPBCC family protein [Hyphomicrobium sp.]|uniref:SRPBCC family protein n=1 Tax=Hyphomicrobium sp. TaxID=82 RepID=UPI002FE0AA2A